MQHFLLLLLFIFITIIKGFKLEPYQAKYCDITVELIPSIQTMILDLDEDFDDALKTCVIKNANFDNSVVLINNNYTQYHATQERFSTNDNPNVIIMTKHITTSVFDAPSVAGVLKSHRSVLFIVVTDDKNFQSINGALDTNDFQRLETFMNQLWQKYKIAHVGITFSLGCEQKIAVYNGKRITNRILYDRTIKLIDANDIEQLQAVFLVNRAMLTEDYPLKANIFDRYPTSIKECDKLHYYTHFDLNITDGYCGLDALMMNTIINHFKFKLELLQDDKCSGYGHNSESNVTGSLGCIVRKELDISFNSRFMTQYSQDDVYFLHFVTIDSLCVLVEQARVIPMWHYSIGLYTLDLWILIVFINVIIGIFWWKTSAIDKMIKGYKRKELYSYIKDAFTSTLFGTSMYKSEQRISKGVCLCCSVLFVALYQGHVNHIFTTVTRYATIETLDELYKSNIILQVTPSMRELMKQILNPENNYQNNFSKRMSLIEKETYTLDALFEKPNTALLGRKKDIEIEILSDYTEDKNTKPLINIVDECLRTYYLSYISRAGFPFVEELQRFMQRVREAGLPKIYYAWTCDMLCVPQNLPKLRSEPRNFTSIKLQQLRLAFGLLIAGNTISLFIFMVELWRGRNNRDGNNTKQITNGINITPARRVRNVRIQ